MNCFKKMVLVLKDQCNLLLKAQVQDIKPAVKKSVQLDDHMSQLLMQDDPFAPKNHTDVKEFEKVHFPNHIHGHTLDLVLTKSNNDNISNVHTTDAFSDHFSISFTINLSTHISPKTP